MQKGDPEQPPPRAADIHLMRLPDSTAATKKAPYIIHQLITGQDIQPPGMIEEARAVVRSIFCVYDDNEEFGALSLLNLMEKVRIYFLEQGVIGQQFRLDLNTGVEMLIYPDSTAPYYIGEMISTWLLPRVKRKVDFSNGF
jgi:hypothetical protein